jgi:hypothetical protein
MVLRFASCSPRGSGFLAPVIGENNSQLDASVEASGPHDFAVRAGIARLAVPARPSHSTPNVRDGREASLLSGRERGEVVKVICPSAQGDFSSGGADFVVHIIEGGEIRNSQTKEIRNLLLSSTHIA